MCYLYGANRLEDKCSFTQKCSTAEIRVVFASLNSLLMVYKTCKSMGLSVLFYTFCWVIFSCRIMAVYSNSLKYQVIFKNASIRYTMINIYRAEVYQSIPCYLSSLLMSIQPVECNRGNILQYIASFQAQLQNLLSFSLTWVLRVSHSMRLVKFSIW